MLDAASTGDTDAFLSTLLLARVLLPLAPGASADLRPGDEGFAWRTETVNGDQAVVVFTSRARLVERLPVTFEAIGVRFVQLIRHWPDAEWSFAVNPDTPVGATLPGSQVVALASWAADVGLGDDAGGGGTTDLPSEELTSARSASAQPVATRPTVMQKPVAPSQVAYYLERGYDRVSGFVHRASEVAPLLTPSALYTALGLAYPGSPFTADATEIFVLRWHAYCPSLYRIPYGGSTESAMQAMEGWVIERPPFRGNGFAPSESSDIIAEFKVDSARLPHGAQLWRVADGAEELVATLDADQPAWRLASGS